MERDTKERKTYQQPQLEKIEMNKKPGVLAGAAIPAAFSNCGNC